jgi:hypothetical protein
LFIVVYIDLSSFEIYRKGTGLGFFTYILPTNTVGPDKSYFVKKDIVPNDYNDGANWSVIMKYGKDGQLIGPSNLPKPFEWLPSVTYTYNDSPNIVVKTPEEWRAEGDTVDDSNADPFAPMTLEQASPKKQKL